VTSFILSDGPVAANLQQQQKLSVLALRHAEGQAFADITSPRGRAGDLAPAHAASSIVTALTNNNPGPIYLPRGLFGFFNGRSALAQFPIASAGNGWQIQGGSFADLRRVGNNWIAIEIPRSSARGIYVSIFVDNAVLGLGL
jgi:hypothetical protein